MSLLMDHEDDADKQISSSSPQCVSLKTQACTPLHCYHAFDALYCTLTDADPIPPSFENKAYPLFVSWHIRRSRLSLSGHPRLRGCIGTFESLPVRESLAEYALISAFNDTRFRKIEERELSKLSCSVSLLTDFEDAENYLDWTIGLHGIQVTFPIHRPSCPSLRPRAHLRPSPLLPTFSPADLDQRGACSPQHIYPK